MDLKTGKWGGIATPYLRGVTSETRKAQEMAAKLTVKELHHTPPANDEQWDAWVWDFFDQRYAGPDAAQTKKRYENSWRTIMLWLRREGIEFPSQLKRAHCKKYHAWRVNPEKNGGSIVGVYRCGHNTALGDIKILRIVMSEAVEAGYAENNPCWRLGIRKLAPAEKRPFTDEEIALIREELRNCPEWMSVSFELALYQALRLRQTSFPMSCIDWKRGVIEYPREVVKGKKPFSHPIDSRVRPLLERLRSEGRKVTCEVPPNGELPSKIWWRLFKRLKIKGVCFHCLRVTWITRAARNHVPLAHAMAFVNHGSTDVHRIYQKLKVDDIMGVPSMVSLPEPVTH